ncbi:MAG: hypothetical protein QNJ16_16290 [Rhodobacter sp.]|nr:hypothetical protein [Rhodobacter sp.]
MLKALFPALVVCASAAAADPLSGTRAVFLESADGTRLQIATVEFDAAGGYAAEMTEAPFTDHFLSMRPFKCLEGPAKHWCHVPYPYEIARQVSDGDLVDLEYDFLFLWKGAAEYGINMWNGVYYKLETDGDRLVGRLHEIDMDILSAPPEAGDLRPVREIDLEAGDPDSHWLPVLVIE